MGFIQQHTTIPLILPNEWVILIIKYINLFNQNIPSSLLHNLNLMLNNI